MSIVSGTVGGVLSARAQNKATAANLQMAKDQLEQNKLFFDESRGASGHALLPTYFGSAEKELADAAIANFKAQWSSMTPEQRLQKYSELQAALAPAMAGANATVNDIFSGDLTNRQLGYAQPVFDARTQAADQNRQAIEAALSSELNRQRAVEAARGYAGTGSFANNRMLAATMAAKQQAAALRAQAELQNAMQKQGIQARGEDVKLANLGTPIEQATRGVQFAQMPQSAVAREFQMATEPMNFFRMTPQAFRGDPLPQVQPNVSGLQMAMQGISQAGGALGNAYINSKGTLFGGQAWGSATAPASTAAATSAASSVPDAWVGSSVCYVAKLVLGDDWTLFYFWKEVAAPDWFRNFYNRNAKWIARWMENKPLVQSLVRRWMLGRIKTLFTR